MKLSQTYLASLSPEARVFLKGLPPFEGRPSAPRDGDVAAWTDFQNMIEQRMQPLCDDAILKHRATISEIETGPLKSLLIRPEGVPQDNEPAVYIHGGGYTGFSAQSSLAASIPLAAALARPLISIDYPLAPHSTYAETIPLATATVSALLKERRIAGLIGESAGGGLALSVVNRLHGRSVTPNCLMLISPWTDLGPNGESRETMATFDPILRYEPELNLNAQLYANNAIDDPAASPVFAEYDAEYPPTLIQCGSREILLSDSLRLYRKLCAVGAQSTLDIAEGMFHSFQVIVPEAPEAQQAMCRASIHISRGI